MNNLLTELELDVTQAICDQHSKIIKLGAVNLSQLRVIRRNPTGVGAYIIFDQNCQLPIIDCGSCQLGFEGEISVPKVPSGLGVVLDIVEGRLNHLELFTYGDETWSGDTSQGVVTGINCCGSN